MTGVADGLRVLDFTWHGVGPITTKYLADNGAEVFKVESVKHPDGPSGERLREIRAARLLSLP